MKIKVEEYLRADGSNPYKRWFDSLDAQPGKGGDGEAAIGAWQHSSVKWYAGIGEYVIDWGPGYRIYLARDGEALIILFGGGNETRPAKRH